VAFVIVFRVAGPRVELPSLVRHGGLVLHSTLIDIGEDVGSSAQHNVLALKEEDVLPSDQHGG
jgi:hypothetical protein